MDLRFCLVAIFLVLDATFVSSTGQGSDNSGPKKKKNPPKVQLSAGVVNNPFLQQLPPLTLPSVGSNPFLVPVNNNKSGNPSGLQPNIFLPHENQLSNVATFTNSNNPFLNFGTDTRVDTESSNASGPVTSAPYRPSPPAYATASPPTYATAPPPTYATAPPPTYATAPSPTHAVPEPVSHNPFITPTFPSKVGLPTSGPLPDPGPIKIGSSKTKSQLKCEEYVREIAGTVEVAPLVGTSSDVIMMNQVCGNSNSLVVGGTEVRTGEFPHMIALGRRNSDQTFILMCGASLISHTWVLTAAHCTYGPNGAPSVARVGFHRITDEKSGVTVDIKNMLRHPEYTPPAMYADIALVELESAVTFSTLIRPACLYQQFDTVPISAWISGWGVTEFGGDQSDRLLKAQLNLVDNLACTIIHNCTKEVPHGVTPSMVCAGDPHGGWTKDTCQGDSGGPLQVIHPRFPCLFQVIGITSFGQGCALIDSPGVYTRVSHYIPWVENVVWP